MTPSGCGTLLSATSDQRKMSCGKNFYAYFIVTIRIPSMKEERIIAMLLRTEERRHKQREREREGGRDKEKGEKEGERRRKIGKRQRETEREKSESM